MADAVLQRLRRGAAQGDPDAKALLLVERARAGQLAQSSIMVAAITGHEPAQAALADFGGYTSFPPVDPRNFATQARHDFNTAARYHRGLVVDLWLLGLLRNETLPHFEWVFPSNRLLHVALGLERITGIEGLEGIGAEDLNSFGLVTATLQTARELFERAGGAERLAAYADGETRGARVDITDLLRASAAASAALAVLRFLQAQTLEDGVQFGEAVECIVGANTHANASRRLGNGESGDLADLQDVPLEIQRLRRSLAQLALRTSYPLTDSNLTTFLIERAGFRFLGRDEEVRAVIAATNAVKWTTTNWEKVAITETTDARGLGLMEIQFELTLTGEQEEGKPAVGDTIVLDALLHASWAPHSHWDLEEAYVESAPVLLHDGFIMDTRRTAAGESEAVEPNALVMEDGEPILINGEQILMPEEPETFEGEIDAIQDGLLSHGDDDSDRPGWVLGESQLGHDTILGE